MRERKYIKFKVDMYDDTKFKIIDKRPDRDLVHYAWTRVVVLAGKVNQQGELYLSKTIPYTIETLAIEFNREVDEIKAAFDVLIELEMIELTEHRIYKVKNFAKHQNIKTKEKIESKKNEVNAKNEETKVKKDLKDPVYHEDEKVEDIIDQNKLEDVKNNCRANLEIINNDISKVDANVSEMEIHNNQQDNIPILLETNKNKKAKRRSKKDNSINVTDNNIEDDFIFRFSDKEEERPLGENECVVGQWSF